MSLSDNISDQISGIPAKALEAVRRGFAIAANLSEEVRTAVVRDLLNEIERGATTIDLEPIAKTAGLSQREIGDVAGAVFSAVGILSQSKSAPSEFVSAALGKLFEGEDSAAAQAIAELIIGQHDALEKSVERGYLAAQTLPSLSSFEISVDLRCRFEGDLIQDAVPVALVHIDTDGQPELWMQLSRGDVEHIRERLNKTLKQMDSAQTLFGKTQSSQSK